MGGAEEQNRIAVIGSGAAGCLCAYFLLKSGLDVTLFDKNPPLLTLLPTGGGRCNLAYAEFNPKELPHNYPRGEKFLYSVFSKFSTSDTIEIFAELGVETYIQEDGKIFPVSNSAKDVRNKLLNAIKKYGGKFVQKEIKDVKELENDFDKIVISIGGHSGYDILKSYNLNIIPPKPSLVGLNTKENLSELSGISLKDVSISNMTGDILFTHFGISGPLIYTISSLNAFKKFPYVLKIDLMPNLGDLQTIFNQKPHKEIKNILSEYFPAKIVSYLLRGTDSEIRGCNINSQMRDLTDSRIHEFEISITGTNKGSETVTAGGIDLDEINPKTMQIKKYPNLYCIGEVLNIDGFCGGFNLQNAWSTACVCAEGIKNTSNLP